MALEVITGDERIIAREDEFLALIESKQAEPRPGDRLLAEADALAWRATRWSCAYCAAEYIAAGSRTLGVCSTCCSSPPAWVPTKLADELELRLGGRLRPFTNYEPWDAA